MGITINGAGSGAASGIFNGTAIIKSTDGVTEMQRLQKQCRTTQKKQLNYNSKEISSQLVRAKKSRNAAMVLTRAKSRVSSLQRCLGTGQYNDNEVRIALAHAKRMVKCAQMKVANLKEEEQLKHRNEREHTDKERQQKSEIKRRTAQKERNLEQKVMLEETQQILKEKERRQELLRRQRIHRNQERGKISDADLKYLKDRMGSKSSGADSSVAIELSMQAVGLSELKLSEHALELLEQQAEMELEGEYTGSDSTDGSTMSGMASPNASGASVAASVDISI